MRCSVVILLVAIGCSLVMSKPQFGFNLSGFSSSVSDKGKSLGNYILDGATSFWKGAQARAKDLKEGLGNVGSKAGSLLNTAVEKVKHAAGGYKDKKFNDDTDVKLEVPEPETSGHYDDSTAVLPEIQFKVEVNDLNKVLKDVVDKSKSAVEDLKSKGIGLVNSGLEKVEHAADGHKDLEFNVNTDMKLEAPKPEASGHHDDTTVGLPEIEFEVEVNDVNKVLKDAVDKTKSAVEDLKSKGVGLVNSGLEKVEHAADGHKDLEFNVNTDVKLEAPKPEASVHHDDTTVGLPEIQLEVEVNDVNKVLKDVVDKTKSAVEDLKSKGVGLVNSGLEKVEHTADKVKKDIKLNVVTDAKLEAPKFETSDCHHDCITSISPEVEVEAEVSGPNKVLEVVADKTKSAVDDLKSKGVGLLNNGLEKVEYTADKVKKDIKLNVVTDVKLEAPKFETSDCHHDIITSIFPEVEVEANDPNKFLEVVDDKTKSAVDDLKSKGVGLLNTGLEKVEHAGDAHRDSKFNTSTDVVLEAPKLETNADRDGLTDVLPEFEAKVDDLSLENSFKLDQNKELEDALFKIGRPLDLPENFFKKTY